MPNDKLYIVRTKDGQEMPPADQETLIKLTEQGKIDLDCTVRSTLVPKWDKAVELPFLKPLLKQQLIAQVEKKNDTWWNHVKARMNLRVENTEAAKNGLVQSDVTSYPTADLWMRIVAGLMDWLILAIWALLIYLGCAWCFKQGILGPENVFYLGFLFFWTTSLLYYILNIYLKTQTPGQKFWGIFLIRNNGDSFWLGRIFFYVVLMIPFGLFTPLFVYASESGRGLHEILTKTRMVKILYDDERRNRKR